MNIVTMDTAPSTNLIARNILRFYPLGNDPEPLPDVIVARKQTKGECATPQSLWFSPEDCGVYMSVIRPMCVQRLIDTNNIGVVIKQTLEEYLKLILCFSGVNDIYLAGRKVSGILCEYHPTTDKLIVGVGLNTYRPNKIRKDLINKAVWLNEYSAEYLLDHKVLINLIAEAICSL